MSSTKILIVEDEFIIAEDVKNMLIKLNYNIIGISFTGQSALDEIEKDLPDLVLMDIMLKGDIDGIETASIIKEKFEIPVIYLTAYTDDITLQRAKITEPFGYILKPFEERELYTNIEMALYKHKAEREILKRQKTLEIIALFDEVTSHLTATDILDKSLNFIKEKLKLDYISIILLERNTDSIKKIYSTLSSNNEEEFPIDGAILLSIIKKTTSIYRSNIKDFPINYKFDHFLIEKGFLSDIIIPLIVEDKCFGAFSVYSKEINGINEELINILTLLAPRLALSIQNSNLVEELRESEQKFRNFTEFLPQTVAEIDLTGKITYANKNALTFFGYTTEEFNKGLNVFDMIYLESFERGKKDFEDMISGKYISGREYFAKKKNGETFPVIVYTNVIINKKNIIVGIRAVIVDISLQKQMESLMLEEKERLAVTLKSIGDGVITTDTEGKIILVNQVAEKLTGFTYEESFGKNLTEIFNNFDEKTKLSQINPVTMVLDKKESYTNTTGTILISKTGDERIIEENAAPIRNKDNQIIGVVIVFRDVTDKYKMQEEILKSKKLESISILAGGIAHDFNNILTAIVGNITLAKLYSPEEGKVSELLTEAEKACIRSKDLTQQLLTFSKGGDPIKKLGSIKDVLIESSRFILRGSNIKCDYNFPEELWSVEMDEGQISQVVSNLIINSSQAMPNGGLIKVSAENVNITKETKLPLTGTRYVKISIADTGVGIPKDYLSKIFDPYFTTKQKGSGLGLAVTYSIINKHSGYIYVESVLGAGTTFYIYLPASSVSAKTKDTMDEKIKIHRGRVLIMDDDEAIREIANKVLSHLGFTVELVENGEDAIELYKKSMKNGQKFDVVIMDLTIPGGMGGKETIKELIKIDPNVKAIVSSGYSTDPVMANYKEYGFKGIITKPYTIKDFISVLDNVVEN
ncbi:MAG: hypothetical protein A2086_08310 [Spirochaetes bacterium GWD1_27_9]|nr:MAG: hypothetical protein A2Z98_12775 [Spirochaetes bacterium GWB1_27_13]OHD23594.1 MAG: hypothetical protein A2Y34_08625 [Spirochaetes bacterium GWC1_27_15]OHD39518.1 MAG: hypothetical protein A2086_08310 [Spirochaetes bacterium GWD1_27_9]